MKAILREIVAAKVFHVTLILLAGFVLVSARQVGAQTSAECPRVINAPRDLDLIDRPPTYSTTSGWTYGRKIGAISSGTPLRICEEREIGFFPSKQRWLRVRLDGGKEGWIYGADIQSKLLRRDHVSPAALTTLDPPTLFDPLTGGSFIFLILGIIGKNVFDYFTTTVGAISLKAFVTGLVPPLVVSPIVFLGVVRNVDLLPPEPTNRAMLVLFLFAFQNGFFWQDVLSARPQRR